MKQTLYQILGVEPQATLQDIEAAYHERLGALQGDQNRDPNMLVALRQAREVLADDTQRAAYDAALANRAAPAPAEAIETPELTFLQRYAKWIASGAVLMALGLWWRSGPPPAPTVAAPEIATPLEENSPRDAGPENEPVPVTVAPAQEEAPDNPIVGPWSCYETVSGQSSRYDFAPEGTLSITEAGGRVLSQRYELAERTLKLSDAGQSNTLMIEEWTRKKMVLNLGAQGRRVVCKR